MIPKLRLVVPLLAGLAAAAAARSVEPVAVPRFTHPGAGQTIYILMPDRFANGDKSNDTGGIPGGPEEHGFDLTRTGYFQGGQRRV